jgi:hypothetical protein
MGQSPGHTIGYAGLVWYDLRLFLPEPTTPEAAMADKIDVTFSMSADDLVFLISALDSLKGSPLDGDGLLDFWRSSFQELLHTCFGSEAGGGHLTRTGNGQQYETFFINIFNMDDERKWTLDELCERLGQQLGLTCRVDDREKNICAIILEGARYKIQFRPDQEGLLDFGRIIGGDISDRECVERLTKAFEAIGWQAFREEKA